VSGAVLKGPTAEFMQACDLPASAAGITRCYAGLIDGLLSDERVDSVTTLVTDVAMPDSDGRRRLAEETLHFAAALRDDRADNG
jgi:LPPG:FO 2-phospho-L-lactate transferase